ncbi:hypothetical protein [Saccharicrinis fermentans]|nr:hypothetical protein [Saccharicrinis fermentans]
MDKIEQLEALQDIRKMMNRSVRFLSLSGLSGLFTGCYALIAGFIVYRYNNGILLIDNYTNEDIHFFITLGTITLILAISTSFLFTKKKARKEGTKLWDESAKNAFINLCIPLLVGGILCLTYISQGLNGLLAPTTLIFYGLALVNASKFTFPMVRQLGIMEIGLGLVNTLFIGFGLIFWLIGFGLLHIIYGTYMYFKYDRT